MEIIECEITDEALSELISRNLEMGLCFGDDKIIRATKQELKNFADEILDKVVQDHLRLRMRMESIMVWANDYVDLDGEWQRGYEEARKFVRTFDR